MTDFSVTGLAELQRFLDQLPAKAEKNILRGALRAGAKVQLARARALLAEGKTHTGQLAGSLRISTSSRRGTVTAKVRAGGGKGKVYWAHWVEFGTAAHLIRARGKGAMSIGGVRWAKLVMHPGARKRPFMRPALDGTITAATGAIGAYIRARLTKAGLEVPSEGGGR